MRSNANVWTDQIQDESQGPDFEQLSTKFAQMGFEALDIKIEHRPKLTIKQSSPFKSPNRRTKRSATKNDENQEPSRLSDEISVTAWNLTPNRSPCPSKTSPKKQTLDRFDYRSPTKDPGLKELSLFSIGNESPPKALEKSPDVKQLSP